MTNQVSSSTACRIKNCVWKVIRCTASLYTIIYEQPIQSVFKYPKYAPSTRYICVFFVWLVGCFVCLFKKNSNNKRWSKATTTTSYNVKALDITSDSGKLTYHVSLFQQMEFLPALPRYLLLLIRSHTAQKQQVNAEEEESTPSGLLLYQCISDTSLSVESSS